jgi:protein-S-isoprenylcysteine O-methyltransferase Ste14
MPYGTVITVLWLILVAYWFVSAWGTKRTVYRGINPAWRVLALVFIIGLFFLFGSYPGYFGRQLYYPTVAARAAGILVCAAGVGFAIWARHTLGTNWSGGPTIKEGHELVESGPYRRIRHPIYTGILLAVLGTGMGSGQVKHVFIFGVAAAILWLKLRIEEPLMLRQFPEAYSAYMKRTKALIPFVL